MIRRIIPRQTVAQIECAMIDRMPEWKRLLVYDYGIACVTRATSNAGLMKGGANEENVTRLCIAERAARQLEFLGVTHV